MNHILSKIGWRTLFSIATIFTALISASDALADGSADMYPSGSESTMTYRAALVGGTFSASDYLDACPYANNGTLKVYAKPGETICVATSAFSRTSGTPHIDWRSPDGQSGSIYKNSSTGLISTRAQELAGPKINGSPSDGYEAATIVVGANQEGVWEIDFNSGSTSGDQQGNDIENSKITGWSETNGSCLINAFDVSVLNTAKTAFIKGRVYVNVLNVRLTPGSSNDFNIPWYSQFYILTNSGYLYYMNTNGMSPGLISFFANNKGVQDNTSYISTSTCSYVKGGNATYKSIITPNRSSYPVYDPRLQDNIIQVSNAEGKMVDYYEDVTHKIFFCKPADDMPAKTRCVYGSTVDSTWLIDKKDAKSAPSLSNLQLVGAEGNCPGIMGPEGMNISFYSNSEGEYQITMEFTDSQYTTRTFTGKAIVGTNIVEWDGKDGADHEVPEVSVKLSGTIKTAEVHFPFIDLDNNSNGLILQQLAADWSSIANDMMYWDDSNLGKTPRTGDGDVTNTTGTASPAHKFVYSNNDSRGNEVILDTWSYAMGSEKNVQISTAHKRFIDLKIDDVQCDKETAHVGDEVIYTIKVSNLYEPTASYDNQTVVVDADADSASVGIWFPDGGFYTTEVALVESDDPDCKVIQQPSGDEYGLGFISLKNGKSATITVKGYTGDKLKHLTWTPQGFIMRPGDYYEIDANNLSGDGMPLKPSTEYTGTNNNMKSAYTIYLLNNAPVANPDVAVSYSGLSGTSNLLANDTDPDDDVLAVAGYYVTEGSIVGAGESVDVYQGSKKCGVLAVNSDMTYSFTAADDYQGNVRIYYILSDQYVATGANASSDLSPGLDTSYVVITVKLNHAPAIVSSSDAISINSGTKVVLPISIYDDDEDAITTTLSGESSVFTLEDGKIYYTGGAFTGDNRVYNLKVSSSDGINTTEKDIQVTVLANHAPTISPTSVSYYYNNNTNKILPIIIEDEDGDPITSVSVSVDNKGQALIDNFSVSGLNIVCDNVVFGFGENVTVTLNITATDERGASTTQQVAVKAYKSNSNDVSVAITPVDGAVYGDAISTAYTKTSSTTGTWTIKEGNKTVKETDILSAGNHTLTFTFIPDDISYTTVTSTATVTVTKRPITLTSDNSTKEYDGKPLTKKSVAVTSGSLVGSDAFYYTNFSSITNIGSAENKFTENAFDGTSTNNYEITRSYGTLTVTTVSVPDYNITLSPTTYTYDGTAKTPAVTVTLLDGTVLSSADYDFEYSNNTNAGTATVTIKTKSGSNYTLDTKTANFTIKPKTLGLTWSTPSSFSYDGSAHSVTATINSSDIVSGDEVEISSYTDNSKTAVGTYTAKANLSNSNYTADSKEWSITEKSGSIEISVPSVTYTGAAQTPSVTVTMGGVTIPESEYTVSYSGDNVNAGTATVTVTDKSGGNYSFSETSKTFTIDKKTIGLTWGTSSFTYDGSSHSVTATATGLATGDAVNLSYTDDATNKKVNTATAAGTYTAEVSDLDNDNYQLPTTGTSKEWTISSQSVAAADYTITVDPTTYTYDGSAKTPSVTVTKGDVTIPASEYKVAYSNNTNAGTATITISDADNGNYSLATKTANFTINPVTVGLAWSSTTSYTYDGGSHSVVATVTGAVNNETVTVASYENSGTTVNTATAAGSYTAKALTLSSTNYQLPTTGVSQSWSIAKKTVGLTWGTPTSFTYDGASHSVTATATNIISGDVVNVNYKTDAATNTVNSATNAGSYTAEASGLSNSNYQLPTTGLSKAWSIEKKAIELNWGTTTLTYNGSDQTLSPSLKNASDVIGSDVVGVSASGSGKDAGTYTVTATLSNSNYEISNGTQTLTIDPKSINLNWSATTVTYDGTEHQLSATVNAADKVGSDVVTVTGYTGNTGTAIGSYTASATLDNANYVAADHDWSIAAETGDVIATLSATTYTYDGTAKEPTVTVKLKNGTVVPSSEYTVAYSANTNAGTATVTITSKGNYDFDPITKEFTIEPKTLDLTWNTSALTYNGNSQGITANLKDKTQIVGDDKVNLSITDNTATAAGDYTAKASVDNTNYQLSSTSQSWSIAKKTVGLTWGTSSFTYDGSSHSVTATATGLATGDVVNVNYKTDAATNTVNSATNAGSYTAEASGLSNSNYQLPTTGLSKAWSIEKKAVELNWGTTTLTYNGSDQTLSPSLKNASDVIGSDVVEVSASGSGKDAGTYTVTATLSNSNYEISNGTQTLTIDPKTINLNWSATTVTYDGTEHQLSATVNAADKVGSDVVTVTGYTGNTGTAIGSYTASATLDNANYVAADHAWSIAAETGDVIATLSATTYTYDGTAKEPTVTVKLKNGTVVPDSEYEVSYDKNTNAGTATVTITSKGNYDFDPITKEFAIEPKTLDLTWNTSALTYNGKSQGITANLKDKTQIVGDDKVTLTVTDNTATAAGDYTAKASVDNTNYQLSSTSQAWSIDKKTIGLTWGTSSFTYDGSSHSVTANVTDIISGDVVNVNYKTDAANKLVNTATNAGDYTAVVTSLDNANYQLPSDGLSKAWSIEKKAIELNWGTTTLTYNGSDQTLSPSLKNASDVIGSDVVEVSASGSGKDAGTYTVTATLSNSNYEISNGTQTLTIDPKTINLNWSATTVTYDGTEHQLSATVNAADKVGSDVVTVTGYTGNTGTAIGSYTASATLDNANYVAADHAWSIAAETGEVSATLSATTYTYDGTAKEPTVTVKLKNGTVVPSSEYTVAYSANTNAGTATVTITSKGNYDFDPITKEFAIEPKTLDLTWNTSALTYNGKSQGITANLKDKTQIVGDDKVTLTVTDNTATAAGDYTAKASVDNTNYQLSSTSQAWSIDKKTIGLTWGTSSFTYDGSSHSVTANVTDIISGDVVNVNYKTDAATNTVNSATNAGSYTAEASGLSNSNYQLPTTGLSKAWSIEKKAIELNWGTTTLTYNGSDQTLSPSLKNASDVIGSDVVEVSASGSGKDAGTYTVTATLSNSNYQISNGTQTLTIDPKTINLNWSATSLEYTGSTQTITPTGVKSGELIGADVVTILSYSGNTGKSVGTYTASAVLDNANYKAADQKWTITSPTDGIVITVPDVIYTGEALTPAITVTMNGETISKDDYDVVYTDNVNAGTATVTVTPKTAGDFVETQQTFTIKPKTINLNWSATYLTYNGEEQEVTASIDPASIASGDDVKISSYDGNTGTNVDAYTASATLTNSNYVAADLDWTIDRKSVLAADYTLTVSPDTYTFDGKEHKPSVTVTLTDGNVVIPISEYNVEYAHNIDAGTATVTVTNAENGNYTLAEKSANFTINKKTVGLTWSSETSFTYNGKEHGVTATVTGTINNESVTASYKTDASTKTVNMATDADSYTAEVDGLSNTNYQLPTSGLTQSWKIEPKTINLSWSATSLPYTGSAQSITATIDSDDLIGTDEVSIKSFSGNTGTAVGSYTASATLDNANYKVADQTWSITSLSDAIAISVSDATYDGSEQEPKVTVSMNGTAISEDEYVVKYEDNINAGTATVTVTPKAGGNYSFAATSQTFTIKPKTIDLDWSATNLTYNGEEQEVTASVDPTTVVSGDEVKISSYDGNKGTNVDAYTASATLSNSNYVAADHDWTIDSKSVPTTDYTITVAPASYTGSPLTPDVTITLKDGTVLPSSEYKVIYADNTKAGTATVTVADATGGNYTLASNTADFTIKPKSIDLAWSTPTTFTYNGKSQGVTADFKNADDIVEGDVVNIDVTGNTGTNVKSYTASATIDNSNYELSNGSQNWTIESLVVPASDYTIAVADAIFDGKAQEPEVTITLKDGTVLPTSEYSVDYKDNTNAGKASVTITDAADGNYTLVSNTANFTIEPLTVGLTWSTPTTFTYNGNSQSVTATVTGTVNDETVGVTYANNVTTGEVNSASHAGTYTAKVTALSNTNYQLPTTGTSQEWTINAKSGSVTVIFGGTTTYTGDSIKPSITLTMGGWEIPASEYRVSYVNNINAGKSAQATISSKAGGNFSFTKQVRSFAIDPKVVGIVWSEPTAFAYDGKEDSVTATVTGTVKDDVVKVSYTNDPSTGNVHKASEVGNYTASVSALDNSNYKLPKTGTSVDWSIVEVSGTISFTLDDNAFTYTGDSIKPNVTVMIGDVVLSKDEYKVSYEDDVNAGDKAKVTVSAVSGGSYTFLAASKNFTINPKEVQLEWSAKDQFSYDGGEHSVEATVTGTVGDDKVSVSGYSDNSATEAGNYTATATGLNSSNYTIAATSASHQWSINPASDAITIILDNDVLAYNGNAQEPNVTVMMGDRLIDVSEYIVSYTDNKNAGTATITISDNDGGNYSVPTTSTTFTIKPVKASINWTDNALTYDGSKKGVAASITNTFGSDAILVKNYKNDSATVVGDYVAKIVSLGNSNYYLADTDSSLNWTISPKAVSDYTIVVDASSISYDGKEQKPVVMLKVGDDTIPTSEYTVTYTNNVNAGEATITITDSEGGNYTIADGGTTFTIAPLEVELNWGNTVLTFNGSEQKVVATVTNAIGDDVVNVGPFEGNTASVVGSYTAKVTGLNNSNYTIASTDSVINWNINPQTVAASDYIIEVNSEVLTYSGDEQKPSVVVKIGDKVVSADEYTVAYSDNVHAGQATVSITDKADGNYTFETSKANFTISPLTADLEWNASQFSYNGSERIALVSVKNAINDDKVEASAYTGNSAVAVGDYTAKVMGLNNSDYAIAAADSVWLWSISDQIVVPEVVLGEETLVYSGNELKPTVSLKVGDVVIPVDEYTVTYADNKDAGTATIIIADKADGNYNFDTITSHFAIAPMAITLQSASGSWTYDGAEHTAPSVEVVNGTIAASDSFAYDVTGRITTRGSADNEFTYRAGEGTKLANYEVSKLVGLLTVTKAVLVSNNVAPDSVLVDPETGDKVDIDKAQTYSVVLNANADELVYNGSALEPEVEIYLGDKKIPTDEYTVSYENNSDAGLASIVIADNAGNYKILPTTDTFRIQPRAVTFESESNSWIYDGNEHAQKVVNVTEGSIVVNDAFDFNVTAVLTDVDTVKNAFTYNAIGSTKESNYKVTTIEGLLAVVPAAVSPIADDSIAVDSETGDTVYVDPATGDTVDADKAYRVVVNPEGEPIVYTGEEIVPSVELYVGNVKVPSNEYVVTISDNKNAGEATVVIKDVEGGNYEVANSETSFTIAPKELEAVFADTTFSFDGSQKRQPSRLLGIIEGDVVKALLEGDTATNAGEYIIRITGVDNSNYTIADTSATWSIEKAEYEMPTLTPIAENVAGAADGHIMGLEVGMEIRKEGSDDFTTVSDPDMDLAAGTYEVRIPGSANYAESETVRIVIESGAIPFVIDSIIVNDFGYCPETDDAIRYYVSGESEPAEYRLLFDKAAKAAGFEDVNYTEITESGVLPVAIPDCKAGTYKAQVQFRTRFNESKLYDVEFKVNLSNKYMTDIWADVVSAVNVENIFEEYQWYHNDVKLEGETMPYYCEHRDLTGSYYMEVKTVDNQHLRTCKIFFAEPDVEITLSAYPNPTTDYTTIELSYDNGEEHLLKVYNSAGGAVLTTTFTGHETVINFAKLPGATYVVNVDGMDVKVIKK